MSSYEIAEMFLKGRKHVRLSQKQFNWLNNILIKETGNSWKFHCLFWSDSNKTKYRINADGSLYSMALSENN